MQVQINGGDEDMYGFYFPDESLPAIFVEMWMDARRQQEKFLKIEGSTLACESDDTGEDNVRAHKRVSSYKFEGLNTTELNKLEEKSECREQHEMDGRISPESKVDEDGATAEGESEGIRGEKKSKSAGGMGLKALKKIAKGFSKKLSKIESSSGKVFGKFVSKIGLGSSKQKDLSVREIREIIDSLSHEELLAKYGVFFDSEKCRFVGLPSTWAKINTQFGIEYELLEMVRLLKTI